MEAVRQWNEGQRAHGSEIEVAEYEIAPLDLGNHYSFPVSQQLEVAKRGRGLKHIHVYIYRSLHLPV